MSVAATAVPRPAVSRTERPRSPLRWMWPGSPFLPLAIIAVLAAITAAGLPYYLLPLAGRVRSPLHPWLKPSGIVGQGVGFATLALFLFMWLYPIRKRVRRLSGVGAISRWLDVHILVGLSLPWLGAIHAGWRFEGLIGLGYASMVVVCLSGVVGKYLYTRIPRSRSGVELTLEEVNGERRALVARVAATLGLRADEVERTLTAAAADAAPSGAGGVVVAMVAGDLRRWRAGRELRRRWGGGGRGVDRATLGEAVRLARRQIALTQTLRRLDATHRIFAYWHVAHLPFAITALVAVLIHVAVAVALGITWLG